MLHQFLDPETRMPRSPMFWVVLAAVMAAQLAALWMLCSHQVRVAEARDSEVQMAQMAMSDCLQYIPGSTIASCQLRLASPPPLGSGTAEGGSALVSDADPGRPRPAGAQLTRATPVSFAYR